nr:hypothetical protein [uncultured Roseateles sp.]
MTTFKILDAASIRKLYALLLVRSPARIEVATELLEATLDALDRYAKDKHIRVTVKEPGKPVRKLGTALGAASGALLGAHLSGFTGALVGGAIGAAVGYGITHLHLDVSPGNGASSFNLQFT